MQLIILLHNIRSAYNVGSIIRTAEGFGVSEIWLSGYTPNWLSPSILPYLADKIKRQIHKTALGAEDMLSIIPVENPVEKIQYQKMDSWQIIGLENNVSKNTILLGSNKIPSYIDKAVLVVGEEVNGIDSSLIDNLDLILEIPMVGKKESFNVAIATSIAIWELMKDKPK